MSFKSAFGNYRVNEELIATTVEGTSGSMPVFGTNGKIASLIGTPIDSNLYVKGGHHQYDTFSEIENIPDSHRKVGMEAYLNTNLIQEPDFVADFTTNAIAQANGKIFLFTSGNTIHVIDGETATSLYDINGTTAGMGGGGRYILNNTGSKIYASCFDNTSIMEIDTTTNNVVRVFTLPTYNSVGNGIIVNNKLYVGESWVSGDSMYAIDLTSGTPTAIQDSSGSVDFSFEPIGNIAYSPTQNKIYVLGGSGSLGFNTVNKIWVINPTTNRVVKIIDTGILGLNGPMYTGNNNQLNIFIPSTQKIWCISRPSATVFSIDTITDTISDQIALPPLSGGASLYLVGNKLFVSDFDQGFVHIVDLLTNAVTKSIPGLAGAGGGIAQVAYNENRLFVPLWTGNGLAVINTNTENLLGIFPVFGQPRAAAYVPGANKVYVANNGSVNAGVLTYQPARTYVLQQDLETWEETTPISKTGDYIEGVQNYTSDFSSIMVDRSIPDVAYVKNLINTNNYEDITYANLATTVSNNQLEPGRFYLINDYVTKYQQPITNTIKTGTTEPILVMAVSTNTFHKEAYSTLYPHDILRYDFEDNVCEDLSTARTGKITFRHDTVNNNYAYYDIRTVKFVRYPITNSLFTAWVTSTPYGVGTIIRESGNLYRCRTVHTSGTFSTDLQSKHWEKVDLANMLSWDQIITFLGGTVYAANTPTEYFTFENGVKNSYVKKSFSVAYNNIVIERGLRIQVEEDCFNGTISGIVDLVSPDNSTVSKGCNNFIINSSNNIFVDVNNTYFFIGGMSHGNILGKLGINNYIGLMSRYNTLNSNCSNNYLNSLSSYNIIGDLSTSNYLEQWCRNNTIGTSNSNIILFNSFNNSFGNNCLDNCLMWATNNRFSNGCTQIKNAKTIANYGTLNHNEFEAGCTDISVDGIISYTYFANGCNDIFVSTSGSITSGKFAPLCSNITMNSNCANIAFNATIKNKTFNNSVTNSTFTVYTDATQTFSNAIIDRVISGKSPNDTLWYISFDNAGATTTGSIS